MHHLKAAGMLVAAVILIPFVWQGFDELATLINDPAAGAWINAFGTTPRLLLRFLPFSSLLPFASILCALALAARYWLDPEYEDAG